MHSYRCPSAKPCTSCCNFQSPVHSYRCPSAKPCTSCCLLVLVLCEHACSRVWSWLEGVPSRISSSSGGYCGVLRLRDACGENREQFPWLLGDLQLRCVCQMQHGLLLQGSSSLSQ